MELDREALIAYVYDVYSVEQAISYTEVIIAKLKKEKAEKEASEKEEITQIEHEINEKIEKAEGSYIETPYKKDFGFFERKTMMIVSLVLFAFVAFWIALRDELNTGVMFLIFIILLFMWCLSVILEANRLYKENKDTTDQINKDKINKIDKEINSIKSSKEQKILNISDRYSQMQADIEDKLNKYYRQKRDFENIRYDLYNDMLLIPAPHQDIFSVCYLYKYLITSRETDLKYIFEQLYQEKILTELKTLVDIQKNILITQRKILAELKAQTNILSDIKGQISTYTNLFETKMNEIRSDLGDISDNQRAILNNQAIMYNAYMQNAVKASANDEERNTYLKMIADSTKVSAMFERADFLDLKFDRNWSGDY